MARIPIARVSTPIRIGLLLAVAASITAPVPPAVAQTEPDFQLELLSQPVWHRPGDRINIKVRVTNNGSATLEGFNLVVGAFFRTVTRSELHASFDLTDQEAVDSFPLSFGNREIAPGESATVLIDGPLTNFFLLSQSGEAGIYPLKVTLQDGAGQPLVALSTQLLYYPQRPATALKTVVVLPIDQAPQQGPDGVFGPDVTGSYPLEVALGGYLSRLARALEGAVNPRRGRALEVALAPTPLLVDEVSNMADGYRRGVGNEVASVGPDSEQASAADNWLDTMRSVAASDNVQMLMVPYSAPDLTSIAAQPDAINTQLQDADVVSNVLETDIDREWLMAPGGRLDAQSLELASQFGVEHSLFSTDSFLPPENPLESGCPEPELSFTCPIVTTTRSGDRIAGYIVDQGLQDKLNEIARSGNTRLELQQFFAETAMIREEQPSNPDRIIQVTIPGVWRPPGRTMAMFLNALRDAPWLETLTPEHGLARTQERATDRELVAQAVPLANRPDDLYFDEIERVLLLVTHFASIQPPDSMVRRLHRNLLIAQSRWWWGEPARGREFLSGTEREINDELSKIGIVGGNELEIALTSREGEIPLTVFSNTGYPVRVNIVLESSRLDLESNVLAQDVTAARQRVTFEVVARSSGQFPLDVRLTTPDGYAFGDVKRITIRSTAFNEIALGITFGALAFLILFYVVRGVRRRGNPGSNHGAKADSV